jgi:hypothetical protein
MSGPLLITCFQEPVYFWCVNESDLADVSSEGLRAKYNKIGYLPYISNPALAGFNYARWGVASPWPKSQEYSWGNSSFLSYIDTTLTV